MLTFSNFKKFRDYLMSEAAMSPLLRRAKYNPRTGNIEQIYNQMLPTFHQIKGKFEKIIKKNLDNKTRGNVKFYTNIKPLESLKDKVENRGKKFEEIGDIVRGALLFDTKDQADEFVSKFYRKNGGMVKDIDQKDKGQDPEYGYYGSHHLDLQIDGLTVELQLMTKKLWTYKSAAHDIYSQNRSKEGAPSAQDTYTSKKLFSMGNRGKFKPNKKRLGEEVDLPPFEGWELFEEVDLTIDF